MLDVDLKNPELYINRELSLLQFQWRVLDQAKDEAIPLLERLRFLCISSTNLDEFFEIRVAGLKHMEALGSVRTDADGLAPGEVLERISAEAHTLVAEQYRVLNEVLIPALAREKIRFVRRDRWNQKQAAWIKRYFTNELLPVLSPLGLDLAHPFPRVLNKSLNFIVSLEGRDAFGRESRIAIVQAPRSLPRLIQLPDSLAGDGSALVFLSSIIHAHVSDLFPGMNVTGCHQFRVTRDSELFVDEEEIDDLMGALKGQLSARRLGDTVRLEVADKCTKHMAEFLLRQFKLGEDDLYQVNGPVNLNRLLAVHDIVDRPDLKYPPFTPGVPKRIMTSSDMFEVIRNGDLLLHHPFESFVPVLDLLRQAAADRQVLAIKQTLYRTGADSPLADALVDAARAGKEVTVVVELRARFDEEANIELATRLQEAGAHVVYGVVGHKTHAKMLLVVRREGRRLRRYVHLGTGNYHVGTASAYTDHGLMTCDRDFGEDVHRLFLQLTGLGRATKLKKLLQSPFTLHKRLLALIEAEAERARTGGEGRIIAKMNSLVEPGIIRALYRASQAGVKIDLIVRGICCLRPGVQGLSENIQVRSVVGRFLEHSRVFYFENAGEPLVYLSSADWMDRNFFRRVETCFPVEEESLRNHVIKEGLLVYLQDNTQAWVLQSDASYKRLRPGGQKPRAAQDMLLQRLAKTGVA
ncbi:MAG: polyphosphate kinase 1 [Gammaproteobacteria bacterium]|nr:polyphosphate kinase 1 [Gammaproteobacteria bacterium]NIR98406.1 polyphosphate kinase 1 [Gammaproteobacteria bacterium]NIT64160.1 polyphosphate kinase 1 [Gammaproteobacteria bacterium]NIV21097.1 polyphosphate kinase 1 [Gammaproteobacteria bacterium]NIY32740.1 polyphosphate kinase 1 [Gammaproteobacteria bacterium]